MIQHGLEINKQNDFPNNEGLLHLAVRQDSLDFVKFWVNNHIDLD